LYNLRAFSKGGKQLFSYSCPEQSPFILKNMSKGMLGKHHSEETKRKIGLANKIALKGKILSIQTRIKLSIANRGRKHSEKTKKKISLANKGRVHSPETRLKLSLLGRGKKMPEEIKNKIRLALKGRMFTKEWKRKISKANKGQIAHNKGKAMEEEQKNKIRITHLKRWDKIGRKKIRLQHGNSEYTVWRKKVFTRDSFVCQECKRRGRLLNAHHIKTFALYPELRYDINNGITLCEGCHKNLHKYHGDTVEFLQPKE